MMIIACLEYLLLGLGLAVVGEIALGLYIGGLGTRRLS